MNAAKDIVRLALRVTGTVQGVGMRPFVFRLARELGLTGFVRNRGGAVEIEIQGTRLVVDGFADRLVAEAPPSATIAAAAVIEIDPGRDELEFKIEDSVAPGIMRSGITPDLAICADCLGEIDALSNSRRAGYAFTSCSNCGPRYSIADGLPYDRATTTMRSFTMCNDCAAEYSDPADRRLHAQAIACPRCGPHLTLRDGAGNRIDSGEQSVCQAARAILDGQIVAVKGIGGFQLVVDATDADAVNRLRQRKNRPDKPFALMMPYLQSVRSNCHLSDDEERLLVSTAAPIVLLRRLGTASVASNVAPANPWLGVMLPYSPLHRLLMDEVRRPVVCTSGNLSDEPICIDDAEALRRLGEIAERILTHDRVIARPLDDSVARSTNGHVEVFRRARGYAPLPIRLRSEGPVTLALGAHQKNTIGLAIGAEAILSQHLGDLHSAGARSTFRRAIDDMLRMFAVKPELLVCDMHPDYASTVAAEELARRFEIPLVRAQHHHAHLAACIEEHELEVAVLGFAWDGTGYGTDGTVWGGESLLTDGGEFTRLAHLRTFPLIGGEAAVRDPRRAALGLMLAAARDDADEISSRWFSRSELRTFHAMAERGINSPLTSSVGRLFDAIAAIAAVCEYPTYDGQAAMQLEWVLDADAEHAGAYPISLYDSEATLIVDWEPMLNALLADLREKTAAPMISARFHNALVAAAVVIAERIGVEQIALGGGCFQNSYLCRRIDTRLSERGFRVYRPLRVPANDGGIALGQLAIARSRWEKEHHVPRDPR